MKEYFYTNRQLYFVLKKTPMHTIDWEANGMDVEDVCENQYCAERNGKLEYLLPIHNKDKFNLALGNLIALGTDGDKFYRVVSGEEYIKVKKELEAINNAPKNVGE